MISILNEIKKFRGDAPIIVDYSNKNRYRVVVNEEDGSKTAYYFSAPIYNSKTRKSIDMKFHLNENEFYCTGSNSGIVISNKIFMKNEEGNLEIPLRHPVYYISNSELGSGNDHMYPTTNGIMYKAFCPNGKAFSFEMDIGYAFSEIRENDRCISLMSGKFKPFVTVSCIGTVGENGEIIAPSKIHYQRLTDSKIRIKIQSGDPDGVWVMFEANLYEDKLVQDTTVESANPGTNNVFGTSAFVGNTQQYGEQWLYSKMNFQKLVDLVDRKITKAVVHFPKYSSQGIVVDAFKVKSRFCSFGSNWSNKIPTSGFVAEALEQNEYYDIDLTHHLTNGSGKILYSEGIILKPRDKNGFLTIATGDSYFKPQIFEVNFK